MLKIRMLLAKLLSFWIINKKYRKIFRNFLFYFSISDFFRFKNQKFCIISLGNNCLPRVLTTVINLKPRKFYGEKTCPFDFSKNFNLNKISELIINDFSFFFRGAKCYDNKWINSELEAEYIHDKNLSCEQFKKRYKQRIDNFLKIINSDKMLYFVYCNYHDKNFPDEKSINNLYKSISAKRNGKPFKIILLLHKRINNIDNINIIQIIDDFKIDDSDWVKRMINQYKVIKKDDKYVKYSITVGNKLKEIIK